ncbi:MAG: malectin domain-containing carbohydrate-binding protein [Prosthecobacter sp.]
MKRFLLPLLLVPVLAAGLQDATPALYSARIDGALQERMLDMTVDAAGNTYVVGSFNSVDMKLQIFGDAGTNDGAVAEKSNQTKTLRTAGGEDIFIVKYDAQGNLLWARSAGGAGNDYGTGVVVDAAGNVYLTGSFSGTADIGGTSLSTTLTTVDAGQGRVTSSGLAIQSEIFVAMLDTNGIWRWARRMDYKLKNVSTTSTYVPYKRYDFGADNQAVASGYERAGEGGFNGTFGWTKWGSVDEPQPNYQADSYSGTSNGQSTNDNTRTFIQAFDPDGDSNGQGWRVNLPAGSYRFSMICGMIDDDGDDRQHVIYRTSGNASDVTVLNVNPASQPIVTSGQFTFTLAQAGWLWLRPGNQENYTYFNSVDIDVLETPPADISIGGTFGMRSGDDQHAGKALAMDQDGNLYLKGRFLDSQNVVKAGGSGSMGLRLITATGAEHLLDDDGSYTGGRNSFVTKLKLANAGASKLDPAQWQWDWLSLFGSSYTGGLVAQSDNIIISDLAVDPVGDIFVTGAWRGVLTAGGTGVAVTNNTPTTANTEGFLLRLRRSDGSRTLFASMRADTASDANRAIIPEGVVADTDGNAYVLGNYNPRFETRTPEPWLFRSATAIADKSATPGASMDLFVAKANAAGEWQWIAGPTAGGGYRVGRSLALAPARNVVITGSLQNGYLAFGSSTVHNDAANVTNPFLAKLTGTAGASPMWIRAVALSSAMPDPNSTVAYAIDAAPSGTYTDATGLRWQETAAGLRTGSSTTATWGATEITGTTDDVLYQTERYGQTWGYQLPVAAGFYDVTFRWAEQAHASAGVRSFNGALEGVARFTSLDIFAEVGRNAELQRTYRQFVSDGNLTVGFTTNADNAMLSALLVRPVLASFGVNCGGAAHTGADGVPYVADQYFLGGSTSSTSTSVSGTSDQPLYQSQRTGPAIDYSVPVRNGAYKVTLKFANLNANGAGVRTFDVLIEGQTVLDDFDVPAAAGDTYTAVDRVFDVTVSDGNLTIQGRAGGSGLVRDPLFNAILVAPQSYASSLFPSRSHGVELAVTPGGKIKWLLSSGPDSDLTKDLNGAGPGGAADVGASHQIGTRTGAAAEFDRLLYYGGILLNTDLNLDPGPVNDTGFFVGQEIVPPAGVYLDGSGRPMQPEIYINGALSTDASSYFQWDVATGKIHVLQPLANAELRWRVSADLLNAARLIQQVESRLPTDTDRLPGDATSRVYQLHVSGGGAGEDEPAVEVETAASQYQFARLLNIGTSAAVVNGRTFKARAEQTKDMWSTLVYTRKAGAPTSLPNTLVLPVRTVHFRDVQSAPVDAPIGTEISGVPQAHDDPSGRNGFVYNVRARYDGVGADAAHNRADRFGPIIPVNQDEPGEDDNLVVGWYSVNARTAVPWPTRACLYHAIWPVETTTTVAGITRTTPEKIFIVSQLGSEMVLSGTTGPATLAVNAGGAEFIAADGTVYAADSSFTPSTPYTHTRPIAGTTDDALYQSGRTGAAFSYALPTGNGSFVVALHFAEQPEPAAVDPDVAAPATPPKHGADIALEGAEVLSGFVISTRAGGPDTAFTLEFPVTVTDGVLNVQLEKADGFDEAQINAIRVTPATLYMQDKLDTAAFLSRRIYHQPDKTLPGYNPNEEHALLAPSPNSAFDAVFALRNDLNHRGRNTSDPYVLMKYQDAHDGGKWKMKVYRVEVTGSITVGTTTHNFDFTNFKGTAGKRVQAPYPLSLFPDQAKTTYEAPPAGTRNAYWQDRKGSIWARSDGQVIAKYWYPLLPDYWLDVDGNGVQDSATVVPWLEFYAGPNSTPQVGDAVKIVYDITWPQLVPQLFVGETLREAKRGLPEVSGWASGGIIFDENEPAVSQLSPGAPGSTSMLRLTARLIDSESERSVPFAGKINGQGLTDEAGADLNIKVALAEAGRYEFPDLEPHLRPRLRFDPNVKRLILRGIVDKSQPAAPLELLNVLSVREREELQALDERVSSLWDTAVQAIFTLARNPNGVNPALITGETSSDIYIGLQHRVDANGVVKNDIVPENVRDGMALTAGLAEGAGYITLTENNDPALGPAPVALHVIKVVEPAVVGSVRVILSTNALDEKITLRHSPDFAGAPDDLFFEWFVKQASAGRPGPTDIPVGSNPGPGWLPLQNGLGLNSVTIEGSGIRTLADQWVYVRYRKGTPAEVVGAGLPVRANLFPASFAADGADIAGDPAYVTKHSPMFVPGWMKRVLEGINPFEQRVSSFHEAPTTSYVSMIQQAGGPFQGAVALNGSAENLNNVGLIELYETVLRRGLDLSINGIGAQTTGAVNQRLLLVASPISDLYMLLANEAFADAQDPTIGFNVDGGNETNTIDSSTFAFQNQLPSLIQEELGLLRGRDDSAAGVEIGPFFNRLIWNFTSGLEGEPAYVLNYEISDSTGAPNGGPDGFIREVDAQRVYPMGHGDAWGHYLSAMKGYYRLLRHPLYTWTPRSEFTNVAGVSVNVDYLDEVKFARSAAARARTAEAIVELTYRDNYVADPAGQWQGYKDTDTERAWGVDEWAHRAGQGAVFDWAVANAILPENDTSGTSSLDKIDRGTVGDLREISSSLAKIQGELDKADQGLNPLGLHNDVIPFDIDPNFTETEADILGQTHFEQVYGRAISAVDNARRTFDHASSLTEQLRTLAITAEEYRQEIAGAEHDFKNRLIEIFGYPYSGDIGPGKAFPSGYDGPDIYKWMYVPVAELTGDTLPPVAEESQAFYSAFSFEPTPGQGTSFDDVLGHYFPGDVPAGGLLADNSALPNAVPYSLSAGRWAFVARPEMGERRAPGTLQLALNEILQAQAALETAQTNYDGLLLDVRDARDLLEARHDLQDHEIQVKTDRNAAITTLNATIGTLELVKETMDLSVETIQGLTDDCKDSLPKVVGLATDPSAAIRGLIGTNSRALTIGIRAAGLVTSAAITTTEFAKEQTEMWTDLELDKAGFKYEIQEQLKALEALLRNEINARLEIFAAQRALESAVGGFQMTLAEGQRVMEERLAFRRKMAGPVQALRYEDIAFRNFRNESLQRYKASFDLAARYAFLAAKTYDYETCLLRTDTKAGAHFLTDIIKQRSLGQFVNDLPVHGVNGLSDPLARMRRSFIVLKSQLGFNNPQTETGQFSLRHELFRLRDSSEEEWQKVLARHRVADLWQIPEFKKFCRSFAPEEAGAQPGLVIPFGTNINFGLNFFGWPLAGGDSAYDSSRFTTKARSVGVWFENYSALNLSTTPRIYLIPVGADVMRSPTGDSLATREFQIVDQALPDPFPIGAADLSNPGYIPFNQSLDNSFMDIRRFSRFRAYHDDGSSRNPNIVEMVRDTRLVGRSVWNTRWLLIIPGGTFLNNADEGLQTFIFGKKVPGSPTLRDGNGNQDIKLFFETYSYSGL